MKILDARSLPPLAQEDLRRKAIRAVLTGRRHTEVAQILGVTRHAVDKWVKTYRQGGIRSLRARPRGRPKGHRLPSWQAAQIVHAIESRTPDRLELPFSLWTRQAVVQLIEQRVGITLSLWTVGRYLRAWGFTPQKPVRRAYEQNPKAVRQWLEKTYPAIRQRAKREKASIFWGDEMGLRSDHQVGRSYSRRGHTPVIPGTGKRFGCNVISALTNRGALHFMVFRQGFCGGIFIRFLERLIRQVGCKVFLIVDGHPVHRSKAVKSWLALHTKKICLFELPGYSPEINPDEMLNQDVKGNALGRKRPRNAKELMRGVRSYLRRRQHQPKVVKRYFEEDHVRYASM